METISEFPFSGSVRNIVSLCDESVVRYRGKGGWKAVSSLNVDGGQTVQILLDSHI